MRERVIWGRKRETVKEREREREKEEESMKIGKEMKSPRQIDVPKLHAYNECVHSSSQSKSYGFLHCILYLLIAIK